MQVGIGIIQGIVKENSIFGRSYVLAARQKFEYKMTKTFMIVILYLFDNFE